MASHPALRRWTIWVAWIVGILAMFLVGAFFFISKSIGEGVNEFSQTARSMFPGERSEALVALVDCESCSLRDRNHAVWALGQLAERRALPVLQKYYTGTNCDHERYICQKELKKALNLAARGYNPSAFLWRWMLKD
jgi:hypothetical protein